MSLFTATLVPGIVLVLAGLPLVLDVAGIKASIIAFPRAVSFGNIVFGVAAAWFLYNVWHLSNADFGEYRVLLCALFAGVAVLSFKCVPDFLGVRGACALMLLAASPFLDAAYMQYDKPLRLFMVSLVYLGIAFAIWLGAQPWRLRDFFSWLFASAPRSRGLGGLLVAYGFLLCGVAFTFR